MTLKINAYINLSKQRILSLKGRCTMEKERKINTSPGGQQPADRYDDGNIPREDLPSDIIPDEVPRKDGPGGENKNN